jgi:hypothetical protein
METTEGGPPEYSDLQQQQQQQWCTWRWLSTPLQCACICYALASCCMQVAYVACAAPRRSSQHCLVKAAMHECKKQSRNLMMCLISVVSKGSTLITHYRQSACAMHSLTCCINSP